MYENTTYSEQHLFIRKKTKIIIYNMI